MTMNMVGQIQNVDPGHLRDIILTITGLLGIWYLVVQLRASGKTRIEPQPLEVKESPKFVTHQECASSHENIVGRVERLEDQFAEMRKAMEVNNGELLRAGEDRARRLHQRIDGVAEELRQMPRHIVDLITKSKQI